eukprot:m.83006 g.83006  ORF g.83006 m.83006 type:complete len:260 (+) comp14747_c0_seq7:1370-2149(+)
MGGTRLVPAVTLAVVVTLCWQDVGQLLTHHAGSRDVGFTQALPLEEADKGIDSERVKLHAPALEGGEDRNSGIKLASRQAEELLHLAQDNGMDRSDFLRLKKRLSNHVKLGLELARAQNHVQLVKTEKEKAGMQADVMEKAKALRHSLFDLKALAANEHSNHTHTDSDLPFHSPALDKLWELAKASNFDKEEMASFKHELTQHYEEMRRFRETMRDRQESQKRHANHRGGAVFGDGPEATRLHRQYHELRKKVIKRQEL